jgi:hypothetical protein
MAAHACGAPGIVITIPGGTESNGIEVTAGASLDIHGLVEVRVHDGMMA